MENKAHALAAGAFVLLLSGLLMALALWLTRQTADTRTYEISTNQVVNGLGEEASVRYRGVKVGKVTDVDFDPKTPGNVLIRLSVDSSTPVSRATVASLGSLGVTGIAYVQLDEEGESREPLATSDAQPAHIPMRLGLVDQLTAQSTRILGQLEETSRRINQLLAPENQQALTRSLGALGQAAASLPPVMQEAGAALQALRQASGGIAASADEVKKTTADYGRLAQRLQQPGGLLDQLGQGVGALATSGQQLQADTLPRLGRTLEDASRVARQVGRVAGTLQDNPQALLLGPASNLPGPGEPGFVPPSVPFSVPFSVPSPLPSPVPAGVQP